jgi:PAS domain S-box-containing protein
MSGGKPSFMMQLKTRAHYPSCLGRLHRCLWLLLVLQLSALQAVAQTGAVDIGSHDSYVLSHSFTYLDDTSSKLTLADVLQPDIQARFRPVAQGAAASTNFGVTDSAIWLRVRLQTETDSPRRWLLEVANPPLDRLDLYQSDSRGAYEHQSGGDLLPFAERPIFHRNHVKPIDLEPGSETILYLRVASQGNVSAPTTLWQPAALWQNDLKTYSVFSLYFGLLIGLLLYNLLLFSSVRDRAYLIYVAFVACIGLSQAANSGLGAQFLWPQAPWWSNNSINATLAASGAFGLLFARSFLASRSKLPGLDRWMRTLVALWVAAAVGALLLPYRAAWLSVMALGLATVAAVMLAGAVSIRRQHPGARYFVLAWSAFLLSIVAQTLRNNGLLPSNLVTDNPLLIGSSLEMVLLSFALADRINVARREKELAQAQVASEQAMVHALQQSQERYHAVIEHVGEGMMVVQNERIVFVNFRATEILEATKAEIMAEGVLHRIHVDDQTSLVERMRLRRANQQVPERCQVRLELAEQPVKWLEFGDHMVPWDGGQGLLVFFLDVTQRHVAELEIRTALDQQQELNELRSRFVAMTSHEFRTPLATILSAQDLLRGFDERLPAAQKLEILDMVKSAVHRMTRMMERVLLLGQAETHMLEFKPQELNLKALCEELVAEARNQQPDSNCRVVTELSAGLASGVYDKNLLRHIFNNLLSNAIKYSPDGGEVRMRIFAQGTQTVFEVSDQGIGIPADEIDHLFGPFHRASNVGDIQGTGLGLAIVKQSVDLHGGTIDVSSGVDRGTCFTIRLDSAS